MEDLKIFIINSKKIKEYFKNKNIEIDIKDGNIKNFIHIKEIKELFDKIPLVLDTNSINEFYNLTDLILRHDVYNGHVFQSFDRFGSFPNVDYGDHYLQLTGKYLEDLNIEYPLEKADIVIDEKLKDNVPII